MSDHKWRLHDAILLDLYPSLSVEKLKSAVKNTGLPLPSVEVFITSLYHKPLPTNNDWRETSKLWFHTFHLWRQAGLPIDWLSNHFATSFVPKLPAEAACYALLDAWNDEDTNWKVEDPCIACLLTTVKKTCLPVFGQILVTASTAKNVSLMNTLYFLDKAAELPTEPVERSGLPTTDITSETLTAAPKPGPSEFAFVVKQPNGSNAVFTINAYHLYARWTWFKRLLDVTNCSEAKSRTASLPDHFTPNIVAAILECLLSEWRTFLSEREALVLLEAAGEYGLTDFETGEALPLCKALINYCNEICFPPLTEDNQLALLARHHRLGNVQQTDALFQRIVDSDVKYSLKDVFAHLDIDLCKRLMTACQSN